MNRLNFVQLYKEDEAHFNIASSLWIPFIKEVHEHDETIETDEKILDGLKKRIAIQGTRKDMHCDILPPPKEAGASRSIAAAG